jgi:hypothetical protein
MMAINLDLTSLSLLVDKYVGKRALVTVAYLHPQLKARVSGYVDSVTEKGMVIRNRQGEFLCIDIAGASEFQLGDERDVNREVREFAENYSSALCFRLPYGALVAVLEDRDPNGGARRT